MRTRIAFAPRLVAISVVALAAGGARAQLLVDPVSDLEPGASEVSGALVVSSTEYRANEAGLGSGDIRRTILGLSAARGLTPRFDLYGSLALEAQAKGEGTDGGNGFIAAAGTRADLGEFESVLFRAYAQLQYIAESYGEGLDGAWFDMLLGAVAAYPFGETLTAYAALEALPISTGEIDAPGGTIDAERDARVGLRGGVSWLWNDLRIRAEFSVIAEQGGTLGVGMAF